EDRFADPRAVMLALSPVVRHRRVEEAQRIDVSVPAGEVAVTENGPGRVLIVDDDAKLRQYCRFALSGDEFECTEAIGGREGLAAVAEGDFDVIVLDVDMPGFNGHEVLAALRQLPQQ